ncbi:bifunctional monodehydroascorbate reductase and carbonic anhydrase nectarin-3-like [Curcuma longa]|uniref:bifunctional monodehydroascorbate reductase and carbonic anhydrase nectarin-3-like n=1 Tax=Curcuma longa TaxID=136217 RepID=UPI003D9E94CB
MGNQILLFLSLLALFFLQSNTSASKAAGFEASSEFSYDPCSPLGPQNWGTLNYPSWAKCTASPEGMQSPISIKPSNIYYNTHLSRLDTYYTHAPALLLNYEGHEIRVSWTQSPGHLLLHDKFFHLRQCHWHAPSEHELFGKRYPLELHMVHTTDSTSEIAVIGVLFEYGGTPDPFLDKLCEALNELKVVNSVDVGSIHPPRVGDEEGYFRYVGSLTTPPCSEPVIWTVIKKVRSVKEDQVNRLRDLLHDMDNARPTQPINGRHVNFSHPHPHGEQKEEGHASS